MDLGAAAAASASASAAAAVTAAVPPPGLIGGSHGDDRHRGRTCGFGGTADGGSGSSSGSSRGRCCGRIGGAAGLASVAYLAGPAAAPAGVALVAAPQLSGRSPDGGGYGGAPARGTSTAGSCLQPGAPHVRPPTCPAHAHWATSSTAESDDAPPRRLLPLATTAGVPPAMCTSTPPTPSPPGPYAPAAPSIVTYAPPPSATAGAPQRRPPAEASPPLPDGSPRPAAPPVGRWLSSPLAVDMAAGAVAGLACDSVMHPMDTIKARLQAQRGPPWRYRGIIHCATRSVRDLGFAKGLYAGFGAVFLGTAPTHALMFGAYRESARELTPDSPHPYALSLLLTLTTASFGEAISLATYVPTEVVAKRMQVAAVGPGRHYRHAFHALSSISRVEGARGLYAGAAATALRDIPYTAVQLALYEAGKALVLGGGGVPDPTGGGGGGGGGGGAKDIAHGEGGDGGGGDGVGFGVAGGLGALAGGIAAAVTNPLDVVKTRLQTQPGGVERMYTGVFDCMRRVVREEGWGALGRGVGARVAWVAPSSAIVLAVFEATGRALGGGEGASGEAPMPEQAPG